MWEIKISIVLCFIIMHFILIECTRSRLTIQKVKQKRIEKTKRDTIKMCEMFNSEFEQPNLMQHKRMKRQISPDDADRIQNMVDKMYDDMPEEGNFRRKNMEILGKFQSGRRFNFAPAKIDIYDAKEKSIEKLHSKSQEDNIPDLWHKRWKRGIVPYFIDPKTYDDHLSELLVKAFDQIEKRTCIRMQRLREKPSDPQSLRNVEWVYINNPTGIRQCVHSNENSGNRGIQSVIFGYECMSEGDIIHNVMHVLGFSHEHTRPDRDKHISILWNNIKPGYKKYFVARAEDPLMNIPYDYSSVLHYPSRAFSRNGQRTIVTEVGEKIGQRDGLSETDIEKIGIVYNHECKARNNEYLEATCPSVVKYANIAPKTVTPEEIEEYYKNRMWQYAIVNYRLDSNFTQNEKDSIHSVIQQIEDETNVEFLIVNNNVTDANNKSGGVLSLSKIYGSSNSDSDLNSIHQMDAQWNRVNKDRDEPKSGRRHASNVVVFTRSHTPGCACPSPGVPEGEKVVQIQDDCFNSVNDLLHLFVHVLGLDHQHNQYDRDSYVHIFWKNLSEDLRQDMNTTLPPGASLGYPYDYQSVMHYPWLRIKNGLHNIMYPIWNYGWTMGHWQGLSSVDKDKINKIYAKAYDDRKQLVVKLSKNSQVLRQVADKR